MQHKVRHIVPTNLLLIVCQVKWNVKAQLILTLDPIFECEYLHLKLYMCLALDSHWRVVPEAKDTA